MQQEIDRIRGELRDTVLEGTSTDGRVRVTVTGEQRVQKIEISPELVTEGDASRVEAQVLSALRDAGERVEDLRQSSLSKVTGGMNLPGLF
jgi:hypothetical protein